MIVVWRARGGVLSPGVWFTAGVGRGPEIAGGYVFTVATRTRTFTVPERIE